MISKELNDHINQNLSTFTIEQLETLLLVLYGEKQHDIIEDEYIKRCSKKLS